MQQVSNNPIVRDVIKFFLNSKIILIYLIFTDILAFFNEINIKYKL